MRIIVVCKHTERKYPFSRASTPQTHKHIYIARQSFMEVVYVQHALAFAVLRGPFTRTWLKNCFSISVYSIRNKRRYLSKQFRASLPQINKQWRNIFVALVDATAFHRQKLHGAAHPAQNTMDLRLKQYNTHTLMFVLRICEIITVLLQQIFIVDLFVRCGKGITLHAVFDLEWKLWFMLVSVIDMALFTWFVWYVENNFDADVSEQWATWSRHSLLIINVT